MKKNSRTKFFIAAVIASLIFALVSLDAQSSDILSKAQSLVASGKNREAIEILTDVVAKHKDMYEAYYLLAKAYYQAGERRPAAANCSSSIKLNSAFLPARMMLAAIQIADLELDNAVKTLSDAEKANPASGMVRVKLAEVLESQGQSEKAIVKFLEGYELDKASKEAVFRAAGICMKEKRWPAVAEIVKKYKADFASDVTNRPRMNEIEDRMNFARYVDDGDQLFAANKVKEALQRYNTAYAYRKNTDLLIKMGYCQQMLNNLPEAERIADDAISKNPSSVDALRLKVMCEYSKGQFADALVLADKACSLDDNNAKNVYWRGRVEESLHQDDAAIHDYEMVTFIDDTQWDADFRLGVLLFNRYKYADGLAKMEIAYRLKPVPEIEKVLKKGKSLFHIEKGNAAFDAGDNPGAITEYLASLDFEENTVALINLAAAYIRSSEPKNAIPLLQKAQKKSPEIIDIQTELAKAYEMTGDKKSAEKIYKDLEQKKKDNPGIFMETALYYEKNGRYEEAEKNYSEAEKLLQAKNQPVTELENRLKVCYFNHGAELFNGHDYKNASDKFVNALKIDPKYADALAAQDRIQKILKSEYFNELVAKVAVLFSAEKYADAAKLYQEILDLKADQVSARYNLAVCYYKLEKNQNALTLLKYILDAEPSHKEAILLMARIEIVTGEYDKASALLDKQINAGVKDADVFALNASIAEKLKQTEKAEKYYLASSELEPGNIDVRISLGNLYYNRNEFNKAQEQYERVLAKQPDNEVARYNLGIIYYKKNRLADSLACFKQVENALQDYHPLYFNMARDLYYLERYSEARGYAEKANAMISNQNIIYKWGLANIYAKMVPGMKDPKLAEEIKQKGEALYRDCIHSTNDINISVQARSRILEVRNDKKFLYSSDAPADKLCASEILGDVMYMWSPFGKEFLKLKKESGAVLWRTPLEGSPTSLYSVGDMVYIPMNGNQLVVLDKETGKEKARFPFSAAEIFIPSAGCIAWSKASGEVAYFADGKKVWTKSFDMKKELFHSAVCERDKIYCSVGTKIVSFDVATGKQDWELTLKSDEEARDLVISKNRVFGEGENSKKKQSYIFSLDASTGKIVWFKKTANLLRDKPMPSMEYLFCGMKNGDLVVFDRDGNMKWKVAVDGNVTDTVVKKDIVFFAMENKNIYGYAAADGKKVFTYKFEPEGARKGGYYFLYYMK